MPKLVALKTTGDGNCLLHAVSKAIYGHEDSDLRLRSGLHVFFKNHQKKMFEFWRVVVDAALDQVSCTLSDAQLTEEFNALVNATEPKPVSKGQYKSLEEIHIFVLANYLRRTIIVYGELLLTDPDGIPISPVYFPGIYLPVAMPPNECNYRPILLAYDQSHFSTLTYYEGENIIVPLVDERNFCLPIRFGWKNQINMENQKNIDKIKRIKTYLSIVTESDILCIRLNGPAPANGKITKK